MSAVNLRLLMSVLVVLLMVLVCCGLPAERKEAELKEHEQDASKEISPAGHQLFKRLILFDKCSSYGHTCHPLQPCCGELKCKYDQYFPPRGKCWGPRWCGAVSDVLSTGLGPVPSA